MEDMSTSATSVQHWVIWVDDTVWGHVGTIDDAKWFIISISNDLRDSLKRDNPSWNVVCEPTDSGAVHVTCENPGYVYSSTWCAHKVYFEPVALLTRENNAYPKCKSGEEVKVVPDYDTPKTKRNIPRRYVNKRGKKPRRTGMR